MGVRGTDRARVREREKKKKNGCMYRNYRDLRVVARKKRQTQEDDFLPCENLIIPSPHHLYFYDFNRGTQDEEDAKVLAAKQEQVSSAHLIPHPPRPLFLFYSWVFFLCCCLSIFLSSFSIFPIVFFSTYFPAFVPFYFFLRL